MFICSYTFLKGNFWWYEFYAIILKVYINI